MIVLKTTQNQLLAALQSVSGIVERRHTLPVLANVLLRKTGETTQLTTSDLEIQIRTSVAPWRCSTCLTMAKPRPVPPVSRERLRSTR